MEISALLFGAVLPVIFFGIIAIYRGQARI